MPMVTLYMCTCVCVYVYTCRLAFRGLQWKAVVELTYLTDSKTWKSNSKGGFAQTQNIDNYYLRPSPFAAYTVSNRIRLASQILYVVHFPFPSLCCLTLCMYVNVYIYQFIVKTGNLDFSQIENITVYYGGTFQPCPDSAFFPSPFDINDLAPYAAYYNLFSIGYSCVEGADQPGSYHNVTDCFLTCQSQSASHFTYHHTNKTCQCVNDQCTSLMKRTTDKELLVTNRITRYLTQAPTKGFAPGGPIVTPKVGSW